MCSVKKSFIRNIIGRELYDTLKEYSILYIPAYVVITAIIYGIIRWCHWKFLSSILSLFTGWSLFSILFIIAIIIVLNIEHEVKEDSYDFNDYAKYKLSIAWGILLIILGITYGVYSNKVSDHCSFLCNEYLVDHNNEIYHIIENDNCEDISDNNTLIVMKGYEIEEKTDYILCPACEEWHEDVMSTMSSMEHSRR